MRESRDNSSFPPPQRSPIPLATVPKGRIAARVLLTVNIATYMLALLLSLILSPGLSGRMLDPSDAVLFLMGWKDNAQIFLFGEYWRLFTAMFLHGSVVHMLSNGFALYVIGPECERMYGTLRFLGIYFVSGFAGGVASYSCSAFPSVGASGAIFGLVGSLAMFFYLNRQVLGEFGWSQLQNIIVIILVNVVIGLSSGGVIDNYAHLGGLAGGGVCGWLLSPRLDLDRLGSLPVLVQRWHWWGWLGLLGVVVALAMIMVRVTPPLPPLLT